MPFFRFLCHLLSFLFLFQLEDGMSGQGRAFCSSLAFLFFPALGTRHPCPMPCSCCSAKPHAGASFPLHPFLIVERACWGIVARLLMLHAETADIPSGGPYAEHRQTEFWSRIPLRSHLFFPSPVLFPANKTGRASWHFWRVRRF